MPKDIETRLDALYRLPLDEFTSARNALAKESGDAAVKQLTKPPVAAWGVNQLYWDRREDYDALVEAAEEMRRTHKAVIEGKKGDLRAATREHDRAIELALKATLQLLKDRGQPATDVTRHAILNTLRALPADEAPGRLSRALSPGGFEMLAGVVPAAGGTKGAKKKDAPAPKPVVKAVEKPAKDTAAKERAVRDAEHNARRMEFESARATRESAKADKHLQLARAAVEKAREALVAAEHDETLAQREADTAERVREAAERKALDAESRLRAARADVSGKGSA